MTHFKYNVQHSCKLFQVTANSSKCACFMSLLPNFETQPKISDFQFFFICCLLIDDVSHTHWTLNIEINTLKRCLSAFLVSRRSPNEQIQMVKCVGVKRNFTYYCVNITQRMPPSSLFEMSPFQ